MSHHLLRQPLAQSLYVPPLSSMRFYPSEIINNLLHHRIDIYFSTHLVALNPRQKFAPANDDLAAWTIMWQR